MAKLFICVCVCLVGVLAEPPVPGYLPPQARNQDLSQQYGAPSSDFGGRSSGGFGGRSTGKSHSYNSIAENQFGGSSSRSRAGPARGGFEQGPSRDFGAPRPSARPPTGQFNAPNFRQQPSSINAPNFRQQPSSSYSAPSARQQPSSSYGAPSARQQPASQYGPPAEEYGAPSARQQPASQFNAPSFRQQPASQYNAPSARQQPSSSYAAAARQQPASQYGPPAQEYGAPFGGRKMDDDLAEPANYEYNYEVSAADESGAEFGHQETREDDFAQGEYHVLLPDGRMQIVEYEADEEGFRPKIRYEETGYPDARDNQGPY